MANDQRGNHLAVGSWSQVSGSPLGPGPLTGQAVGVARTKELTLMAVHAKFGRTKRRRGRDIDGSNPNVGRSCPLLGGSPKRQIYASDTGGRSTRRLSCDP